MDEKKNPGGDQELRAPTLIREHPFRGEGHAGEATNGFWSMSGNFMYHHHVETGVKLYSPREESFPIPLNKFGCYARTPH